MKDISSVRAYAKPVVVFYKVAGARALFSLRPISIGPAERYIERV